MADRFKQILGSSCLNKHTLASVNVYQLSDESHNLLPQIRKQRIYESSFTDIKRFVQAPYIQEVAKSA